MNFNDTLLSELETLASTGNLRSLPQLRHEGREVVVQGVRMLNLSSNDYLGLASDTTLRPLFLEKLTPETFLPSASSSRLLTGNFSVYEELEAELASLYGAEAALTFGSGYHANTGILPALAHSRTLLLADKLVHASLIDGIRLSSAPCVRYRHANMEQLSRLVEKQAQEYDQLIIVTESIFSMDGDVTDLAPLVALKKQYPNVLLYLDEAHAFGVRGVRGLGCAEEQGYLHEIDFLIGTFGKALASTGAFVICSAVVKQYLINRMRTFIFTTALPPLMVEWTRFLLRRLADLQPRRQHLLEISQQFKSALTAAGYRCPSASHILPIIIGSSTQTLIAAENWQRKGFYVLPVRPPTVPEGTSRLRFSLTADVRQEEMEQLIREIHSH